MTLTLDLVERLHQEFGPHYDVIAQIVAACVNETDGGADPVRALQVERQARARLSRLDSLAT